MVLQGFALARLWSFFGNKTKKQSRPVISKAMFVWGVAEQSPFWFLRGMLTVLDMYVLGFVFLALFIVIGGGTAKHSLLCHHTKD